MKAFRVNEIGAAGGFLFQLLSFGNVRATWSVTARISFPGWCLMEDLLIKAATLVAVGLATFSSFPSTAQQQDSTAQQQQPATQQVPPVAPTATPQNPAQPSSGAELSPAAAQLKPVSGELVDKLDSKSAKQGDSVVVKTNENLEISRGTEIPKGSKLVGHITNVQPRSDGHENSQIAIQFDRAELKGGQSLSIETVIQSVSPANDMQATTGISNPPGAYGSTSATMPTGGMGSTAGAATSNPAMGSSANGSMNQNNMENRPGLASNSTMQPGVATQPGVASQSPDSNAVNAGSSAMGTSAHANPAPGSIVARNGNVAIRTTSVPGVLLANDIHGLPFSNASGMLLGARRDVRLDGGTRFVLAGPPGPPPL